MNLYFSTNGHSNEVHGINTFLDVFRDQYAEIDLSALDLVPIFLYSGETIGIVGSDDSVKNFDFKYKLKKLIKRIATSSSFLSFMAVVKIAVIPAIKNAIVIRKDINPNLCHAQDFYTPLFLNKNKTKIIMTVHAGGDPFQQVYFNFPKLKGSIFGYFIESAFRKAIKNCDAVVCLGYDSFEFMNTDSEKFYIIPNGIPDKNFDQSIKLDLNSDLVYLISVGSLAYRKGFDLLIEAMEYIPSSERSRLRIHIYGEGPERELLTKLIRKNNLEDIILLNGIARNIDFLLPKYNYFILCSREEGLPIALLEAMRSEIPCVVTNVGNISSMINDSCCLKIQPTAESIAAALNSILSNHFDFSELGTKGRKEFLSKFNSRVMVQKYINIYSVIRAF